MVTTTHPRGGRVNTARTPHPDTLASFRFVCRECGCE